MNSKLLDQAISIISNVNDMTIATIREDGFPQATTVSYVNNGLSIFFVTPADGQKAHNILLNNKVSLTIDRSYKNWNDIEGLSMGALAIPVSDPTEKDKIIKLFLKKFPAAQELKEDVIDLAFFRIEPRAISILDYKKGFGHTELIEL